MVSEMPRWDLTPFFPSLDSPEFANAFEKVRGQLEQFKQAIEAQNLKAVLDVLNPLSEEFGILYGYVMLNVTTNTRDELAAAKNSEVDALLIELQKLQTQFYSWIGTLDLDAELEKNPELKEFSFFLGRAKFKSSKLMSPAEEALAAELSASGAMAWEKLYSSVGSQLEVTVKLPDGEQTLPMSSVRNLAFSPDREVRRAAFEAEIAAFKQAETPMAACMNGIKHQVNVITSRRGWESALDEAVYDNYIDRETLEAMLGAAREAFPDFRKYLMAKAKLLGLEKLEWYDLFAPLEGSSTWEYDKASDFVAEQFDQFSKKMGDFAREAFRLNWIDWPPMPGKVSGAYCMPMGKVSRVLMNFDGTFGNVKTLAHELGHAYHNLCIGDRNPINRETPATLAETASIFCETIVKNAVLKTATGQERLAMLEASIMAPAQTVVDITSRFLFESAVFEQRKERELSAREMCEIMENAQRDTYGDALASYHPYMWAAKPHYYSTYSFYNFPYMFGLLFSLGLYSLYKQDPDSFVGRYDDLLSSTGMADAYELGKRFGFDTRSIEFWRGSLDVVREDIRQFCEAVG